MYKNLKDKKKDKISKPFRLFQKILSVIQIYIDIKKKVLETSRLLCRYYGNNLEI